MPVSVGFFSESLIFCMRKSDSLMKKSESLLWLFCHEQWKPIPHSHSFVKSDREQSTLGHKKGEKHTKIMFFPANRTFFFKAICSNMNKSLTSLFLKKSKAICSHFCKEGQERFTHSRSFIKSFKSDSLTVTLF